MTNFPRLRSAGLRGAAAAAKAQLHTVSMQPEPSHTFYRYCFCEACSIQVAVPVQRKESEIPTEKRKEILAQVGQGAKLAWPFEPSSEEEAKQIAMLGVCPNNSQHRLKYIWNIGWETGPP